MSETTAELTAAQQASVALLAGAFEAVRAALVACDSSGLEPVEAFGHVGIEIPAFAAPMLNQQLAQLIG